MNNIERKEQLAKKLLFKFLERSDFNRYAVDIAWELAEYFYERKYGQPDEGGQRQWLSYE